MDAKTKYKLLVASLVPIFLLVCKISVSKTFDQYQMYQSRVVKHQTEKLNQLHTVVKREEQNKVALKLKRFISDSTSIQKNLLNSLTTFCTENKLQFKEYIPQLNVVKKGLKIFTSMIAVEGEFIKCLQLVYALENEWLLGKVSSVHYSTKLNPLNNQITLQCIIYIQNIIV